MIRAQQYRVQPCCPGVGELRNVLFDTGMRLPLPESVELGGVNQAHKPLSVTLKVCAQTGAGHHEPEAENG
jgi:hypothetical protein